jgi:transposase
MRPLAASEEATAMPKLLRARAAVDAKVGRQIRKPAASRHAPGDWIWRARMVVRSWDGLRTGAIAAALGCHPQTVRERLARCNAEGRDGLADRPDAGRKRRLTETERGRILALARTTPPGRLIPQREGLPVAEDEAGDAHWTLDALVAAAAERGVTVGRSQVRRIFRAEGKRWRRTPTWAASKDPDFGPQGRRSSPALPPHPTG